MGMTKKMKSYLISHSPPPSNLSYDVYSNAQHFSCAAALEYNGLKMVLTTDKIMAAHRFEKFNVYFKCEWVLIVG